MSEKERGESHALKKAQQKIQEFRDVEDQNRQIAGSGGKVWDPTKLDCPLEPASDHIIVRKEEAVGKVGMIHLPGRAAEKTRPNRGTVLKIGIDVNLFKVNQEPIGVSPIVRFLKEGDEVIYHEYGEVKFTYGGVDFIAIREKDVICRVTFEPEIGSLELSTPKDDYGQKA